MDEKFDTIAVKLFRAPLKSMMHLTSTIPTRRAFALRCMRTSSESYHPAHAFWTAERRHRHGPHIVSVLDYGFDDEGLPYFTMPLLENTTPFLTYVGRLDWDQRIQLIIQLLQALAYLHRHGILHRDLKPTNLLIHQNQLMVMDFGWAVEQQQSNIKMAGTLAYMSPEALTDGRASVASDLYAVGVIAYEMLVGRHPFNVKDVNNLLFDIINSTPDFSALKDLDTVVGDSEATPAKIPDDTVILDRTVTAMNTIASNTPPLPLGVMANILSRLLDKNPVLRYQDAIELIDVFSQAMRQPVPQ